MRQELANRYDVVLAGGGLASTLLAVRLRQRRPDLTILVIERSATLGADHTWSFHDSDISSDQRRWLAPFVAHRWPDQELRFPDLTRVVDVGYNTITSEQFHAAAMAEIGDSVLLDAEIADVSEDRVALQDGREIAGACVIDGRGPEVGLPLALGFQKFYGLEVICRAPHGEQRPVIMDATVAQNDGYRFVYTLPYDTHRILIEDTYYSDGEDHSVERLHARVMDYVDAHGWDVAEIARTEQGVLPVVLGGDIDALWRSARSRGGGARIGLRAALFHPTTGYSLPDAVRVADHLSGLTHLTTAIASREVEAVSRRDWHDRRYFRMLNRMLFKGADPDARVQIFQHFYKVGRGTISRFYAADLTLLDKLRILSGKPPIPVSKALPCLSERSVWPQTSAARSP
ncbi:MAG: lycopene beta-cyclase CrtY [Pseudomonadota bacterium]